MSLQDLESTILCTPPAPGHSEFQHLIPEYAATIFRERLAKRLEWINRLNEGNGFHGLHMLVSQDCLPYYDDHRKKLKRTTSMDQEYWTKYMDLTQLEQDRIAAMSRIGS